MTGNPKYLKSSSPDVRNHDNTNTTQPKTSAIPTMMTTNILAKIESFDFNNKQKSLFLNVVNL